MSYDENPYDFIRRLRDDDLNAVAYVVMTQGYTRPQHSRARGTLRDGGLVRADGIPFNDPVLTLAVNRELRERRGLSGYKAFFANRA